MSVLKAVYCGIIMLVGALSSLAIAETQSCTQRSSAHTVALLELYTSEGCSSCPPADKFVSQLSKNGLNSDQVIALSLHVDYWDYIGWKDRFARSDFSERQRALSKLSNARTVYTPEFFVSGQELRSWQSSLPEKVAFINARPAAANIQTTLGSVGSDGKISVAVQAQAKQKGNVFVALSETGLISSVQSGENQGVTLRHDHVVREWLGPIAMVADGSEYKANWSQSVTLPKDGNRKNISVVTFVQTERGEILQAMRLPLCQ